MTGLQDAASRLEEAAQSVSEIDFTQQKDEVAGAIHSLSNTLNLIALALENAANAFRETFTPEPASEAADTNEVEDDEEE